jgi:hypothetical protein
MNDLSLPEIEKDVLVHRILRLMDITYSRAKSLAERDVYLLREQLTAESQEEVNSKRIAELTL